MVCSDVPSGSQNITFQVILKSRSILKGNIKYETYQLWGTPNSIFSSIFELKAKGLGGLRVSVKNLKPEIKILLRVMLV